MKEYREKNKEKLKEISKEYYENNKEEIKEKSKEYYENNKEEIKKYREKNKEKLKERKKEYRENNKEKIKEYRENNKEKIKEYMKEYRKNNKEKIKERRKCIHNVNRNHCKECNPLGHLKSTVSNRVRSALKSKKSKASIEYLGCDIPFYKEYLENQFKPGMTWENHGEWHIDHIIPVFYKENEKDKLTLEETIKRLHYTNTQPLWASENMSKNNRYIGDYIEYDNCILMDSDDESDDEE